LVNGLKAVLAASSPISEHESRRLASYLSQNPQVWHLLETLSQLPFETWLAAGSVMQTVWNIQLGRPPAAGIRDYDLIYFDGEDLSWEAEDQQIQLAQKCWPDLAVELRNQARVHLWYPDKFGVSISPLASLDAALRLWPATCHAIAVRLEGGHLNVLAPWGLEDLWQGCIRANPSCPDPKAFGPKAQRWKNAWPHLKFV
jgi:hypothetical protein